MSKSIISTIRVAAILSMGLGLSGSGVAQFDGSSAPIPRATLPSAQPGFAPDYSSTQPRLSVVDPNKKLTAGDQVTVQIVEDREAGFPRVVTATGELDVPPLGRVRVSGQTAKDAEKTIKVLLEKEYYYTATVLVSIDQVSIAPVKMGSVLVSGSKNNVVRVQGQQMLVAGEPLTLTTAVLKAMPTEWANLRKVQITRMKKEGGIEKIIVDVEKIIKTGDANSDPVLQDGDRILVPDKWIRLD
jgi:protein involved in polysaccharide export with SLBB domain